MGLHDVSALTLSSTTSISSRRRQRSCLSSRSVETGLLRRNTRTIFDIKLPVTLQNTTSEVSKVYVRALRNVVDHGVRRQYFNLERDM